MFNIDHSEGWHPSGVIQVMTPCAPVDTLAGPGPARNALCRGVLWALPVGVAFWVAVAAAIWAL